MPAHADIHAREPRAVTRRVREVWIPAFAGMTRIVATPARPCLGFFLAHEAPS
jgi:hypothetical protein